MPVLLASTIVQSVLLLLTVRPVTSDIIILLLIPVWLALINILAALNVLLELASLVTKLDILLVLLHVQSATLVWQVVNSVLQVQIVLSVQLGIIKQVTLEQHLVPFAQHTVKSAHLISSVNLVLSDTGYQEILVRLVPLLVFLAVHLQRHAFPVLLDTTLILEPALPALA